MIIINNHLKIIFSIDFEFLYCPPWVEYLKNLISPEHKGLLTSIEGGGGGVKKM